jgi:hypothetical protein
MRSPLAQPGIPGVTVEGTGQYRTGNIGKPVALQSLHRVDMVKARPPFTERMIV